MNRRRTARRMDRRERKKECRKAAAAFFICFATAVGGRPPPDLISPFFKLVKILLWSVFFILMRRLPQRSRHCACQSPSFSHLDTFSAMGFDERQVNAARVFTLSQYVIFALCFPMGRRRSSRAGGFFDFHVGLPLPSASDEYHNIYIYIHVTPLSFSLMDTLKLKSKTTTKKKLSQQFI
jgi:hypothetical protein